MAMIQTHNGKRLFVTAQQGAILWLLLNGERTPKSKQEREYVRRVKRVYLAYESAPESYKQQYVHVYKSMHTTPSRKEFIQPRLPYKH